MCLCIYTTYIDRKNGLRKKRDLFAKKFFYYVWLKWTFFKSWGIFING